MTSDYQMNFGTDPNQEVPNTNGTPTQNWDPTMGQNFEANPYTDRITQILQQKAQPIPITADQTNTAGQAAIYYALAGKDRTAPDILNSYRAPIQAQQDRAVDSAQSLYNVFEQQRTMGNKDAQATSDAIGKLTSDPAGQAQLLQYLHNLPEKIDPHNQNQILMALARGKKELGVQTDFERTQQMNALDMKLKQAEVLKATTEGNKPLSEAGKRGYDAQRGYIQSGDTGGVNIQDLPDATTRKAAIDEQKFILSAPDIVSNLDRARILNNQTFDTGLVSAKNKMSLSRGSGIDKDALKKTAEYQNIIDRQVVTQMKSMFTRPTEYETKLVQKIEGSLESSIPERESILNEAINYLQQKNQESRDTLSSLGVRIKEPTKSITGDQRAMPGGILPSNIGNDIPQISSPSDPEFAKLPSGSQFKTSDGQVRVKH